MNTRNIVLDVSKQPCKTQIIRVGPSDVDGVTLKAEVADHGEALSLTGLTATLLFRINGQLHEISGTVSGNVATFHITSISPPGTTDNAYVSIEGDGFKLSTSRFSVEILEGAR